MIGPSRVAALLMLAILPEPGHAWDRGPSTLRHGVEAKQLVPLSEILDRLIPRMAGADYIGAEFDAATLRYRLKFISGRQVVWVDVDARNGRILGRFSS